MFVMSGRPTHHPDAFLSESFRKPDSFGYIQSHGVLQCRAVVASHAFFDSAETDLGEAVFGKKSRYD